MITIVGGGTAGWLSALIARQFLPGARIVVVESKEIGILGAGEGTTPHFVGRFLDFCQIPMSELVKHCGATFKNGIRFVNWRGDGSSYFHPFINDVSGSPKMPHFHPERWTPPEEVDFTTLASLRGKCLMRPRPAGAEVGRNPLARVDHLGAFAVHFDAKRLAAYLKRVALSRNVEHIEDTVTAVLPDPSGGIDSLVLADNGRIGGRLFVDCTGFSRVMLGKHFGVRWIDVAESLPVDRALPFFLPLDGPRPPFTDAIAMEAGWVWKIPVEGRYGCGYVYDSDFIGDDDARAEVRRMFGAEVDMPRVLSFRAGYHEKIWVKNCFGVGLATGFLEPLEATSIWASLLSLIELFQVHLAQEDDRAHDAMNDFHRRLHERIVDFLYLHYMGGRSDTEFWRTLRERTKAPEMSAEILDGGLRWPFEEDPRNAGHPSPFPAVSWLWIAAGVGLLDRKAMARYWSYFALYDGFEERMKEHGDRLSGIADGCIDHERMLEQLRTF